MNYHDLHQISIFKWLFDLQACAARIVLNHTCFSGTGVSAVRPSIPKHKFQCTRSDFSFSNAKGLSNHQIAITMPRSVPVSRPCLLVLLAETCARLAPCGPTGPTIRPAFPPPVPGSSAPLAHAAPVALNAPPSSSETPRHRSVILPSRSPAVHAPFHRSSDSIPALHRNDVRPPPAPRGRARHRTPFNPRDVGHLISKRPFSPTCQRDTPARPQAPTLQPPPPSSALASALFVHSTSPVPVFEASRIANISHPLSDQTASISPSSLHRTSGRVHSQPSGSIP